MLSATADAARLRDPAALPRLLLTLLTLALLWPAVSLSEFDLSVLWQADNTASMGKFLAGFAGLTFVLVQRAHAERRPAAPVPTPRRRGPSARGTRP